MFNILLSRTGTTDPVTYGLALLVHHFDVTVDVQFWSQKLSFAFVGFLTLFSIRGLLLQFMKASRLIINFCFHRHSILLTYFT